MGRKTAGIISVSIVALASCNAPAPKRVQAVVPVVEAPHPPRIVTLSDERNDETSVPAAPIPSVLPPLPARVSDPVGVAIEEARMGFDRGESLYQAGYLTRAREEFDTSVDTLLESSAQFPGNSRLSAALNDIVLRIHTLEISAIRQGDGFKNQKQDHAAVDDLQNVQTFPTLIDPELKQVAESDVKEITHDLPIEINDRVLGFLDYYQKRGRNSMTAGLERMGQFRPTIERILKEEKVPLDLIYLCQAESAFLPRATSRAKARGLWQFISSRGKEYGLRQTWWIDERSDPEKSTRAAARHLRDLYEEFGDWYLAMAAYNAGPGRVKKAIAKTGSRDFWTMANKKALPKETINYVPTILALSIIGKNPEKYGFAVTPDEAIETDRVPVDKATDLRVIAEAIGVPVNDLKDLNAHMLRMTTPPDDPEFELILPKGYREKFVEQMASVPDDKRVLWQYHIVKSGDTLSGVAKKYGSTVAELTQANNITTKKNLQVGQSLLIPIGGAATQAVQANAGAAPKPATYTVQRGDTLGAIASRFKVTVSNLEEWNHLSSSALAVGKKLVLTAPPAAQVTSSPSGQSANAQPADKVVHRVRSGETLNQIAATYKTTVDAILAWNNRANLSVIHPGDQITIYLSNNE